MNKKRYTNFSKNPLLTNPNFYTVAVALLLIAGVVASYYTERNKKFNELVKAQAAYARNDDAKTKYLLDADELKANANIRKQIDSLESSNAALFDFGLDSYISKLDKKYTVGKFFNANQIAGLNKVISKYSYQGATTNQLTYKYVKTNTPIIPNTPLRTLEYVVDFLNIRPIELIQYGVEFDKGEIFRFNNTKLEKLFYQYLDDYEAAYSDSEGPNFEISEMMAFQDEYTKNSQEIAKLKEQTSHNDSIFKKNLAQFDAKRDSLNHVIKNLKSKLK